MIFESLALLKEELKAFITGIPNRPGNDDVVLDNIAMLDGGQGNNSLDQKIIMTLVGLQEEATLKNLPHFELVDGKTAYKNPPLPLNMFLLVSANSNTYENSLYYISKVVEFFQGKTIFTPQNSPVTSPAVNFSELIGLRLTVQLHSPSFEEVNYIWGTLGGKQIPHVCYKIRMVEVDRQQTIESRGIIKEVQIKEKIN